MVFQSHQFSQNNVSFHTQKSQKALQMVQSTSAIYKIAPKICNYVRKNRHTHNQFQLSLEEYLLPNTNFCNALLYENSSK